MRKALTVIVCLLVIAGAGASAIWQLWLGEKVHAVIATVRATQADNDREGKVFRPQVPDDPNFGTYRDPITNESEALQADVLQRFATRDFAGLDALAEELRAKRARFGSGVWKIDEFYGALELNDDVADSAWEDRIKALRDWQKARPLSITARVALAKTFIDYAWKARGTDYANSVSRNGWKLFEQRLGEAWTVLKEARALPEKDPRWWFAAQSVALGLNWPRDDYEKLFSEAIAFEPEYWGYYTRKAIYLLPRWNGKPGEWERFAEDSIKVPGGLGPEIYARIIMELGSYHSNIFHESKARWDLTKTGFQKIRERYPDSTEMLSEFAMVATQGNDPKCSREIFDALGERIDRRTWESKDRYLYYYRYSHPEAK